jgi:molybdopterin-guanine dinucleotide biosynthesis protein A
MESASAPLLLVLPCDTPLLKASLIQRLIECALEHCDSIVCLEDGEYSHPLHAVIPLSLKQSLEDYLIGGGRSVVKWYAMHQVIRLKVSSEESVTLANINRPSDIEMHKA